MTLFGRPEGCERARVGGAAAKELVGGDAFGFGLPGVGGQVCRHLLGEHQLRVSRVVC
jgi:hypothetical protein